MNENENLVATQAAENTENTAEQTAKVYTQEEVDAIVGKAKARVKAKTQREYEKKYGDLEEVLKAGTGKENVEEVTDTFRDFYTKKGIVIPQKPRYSAKEETILAQAEADEIIGAGFDEVVEETDRLAQLGVENMTPRQKAVFKVLAEHRQNQERGRELSQIGVTEDVYGSAEFKTFASKFASGTPVREIYDIFSKTQPKKDIKPMGSMTNTVQEEDTVKDFYTPEEARRFTKRDLDRNPALFKAIENSMLKWRK